MGYTHHWYRKPELNAKKFAAYAQDVTRLLSETNIPLTHTKMIEGEWVHDVDGFRADAEEINFNGRGSDSHETFFVPKAMPESSVLDSGDAYEFTKTARKPYDVLVVACIILGQVHFGKKDFKFSTDGDLPDLQQGLDLVNNTFGLKLSLIEAEGGGGIEVIDRVEIMPAVKDMDDFVRKIDVTY